MNEHADSDSAVQPRRPVRRRMWACLRWLMVILFVAGCVVVWLGWRPKLPSQPVHLARGEDGQLLPAPDEDADSSGLHLELQAAKINASNRLTSTSSEARTGRARFACRRMAIFNASEHLLAERVGPCMLEHLKDLRGFDEVHYYPFGELPEQGELAPDVTVTLTLAEVTTSGVPGARTLDAQIGLAAGSSLMRYPSHYSDGLNPPQVRFDFAAKLEHHSTTTGVGTPSARYKLAAEDIGKQLGEGLAKKLNDLYEKDGPLPALPDAFYPPYTPPPDLPLPPGEPAELLASYRGLMKSNESLWRFRTDRELADVLTDLEARLKEAGWKTQSLQTAADSLPLLRMSLGEDVLMVYPKHERYFPTPGTIVIHTPDATLVCPKAAAENIKALYRTVSEKFGESYL